MARKKLADLVNERQAVDEAEEPEQPEANTRAAEAVHHIEVDDREYRPQATQHSRATAPINPEPPIPTEQSRSQQQASRPAPKYLRLQRKEARLREDQLLQLTALARRMSREKRGKEERITENTLLRVAVDLLLAREDDLRGETEEEMQSALGLGRRASRGS